MMRRCYTSTNPNYPDYGGRGIHVCARWRSFANFLADMGPRPTGARYTLDRINNDGNYEPLNCRWATYKQQNRNYRRNVMLTINGKTQCMRDWAKEVGLSHHALRKRLIVMKMKPEDAINPVRLPGGNKIGWRSRRKHVEATK